MTYRTTRRCDRDIAEIYLHGCRAFGVDQAERYVVDLRCAFEMLAAHPRMARERLQFKPPVRMHPFQSHMIVFLEHGDGILVVRVLHGRSDWERHLA